MIRGLFTKELRQHGGLFFFALILLAIGMEMMIRMNLLVRSGGSAFALMNMMLWVLFPLLILILANALIAAEFRQRTQLFLEALPLPRWLMLTVKYLLGLTMALLSVVVLLVLSWIVGVETDAITRRFALLLIIKASAWAAFCWAVCFSMAFLGRYRVIAAVALVGGLIFAQQWLGMKVNRFGPFELIGDQFAYERSTLPITELLITLALIVVVTAFGFMLGLVRDATLATMLSEKMSARERATFIILTLVALMMIGHVKEQHENTDPLSLPGSIDIDNGVVTISAAAAVNEPTDLEKAALKAHASAADALLKEVATYLRTPKLPPLFLVHRRDLEKGEIENGDLDSRQGTLLRLNLLITPTDDHKLQTEILYHHLGAHQHFRKHLKDTRWVLRGFSAWWPQRGRALSAPSATLVSLTPTGDDLRKWLTFEEGQDERDAADYAALCIHTLSQAGPNAQQQFLSSALGSTYSHDGRGSLRDLFQPLTQLLNEATSWTLDELAKRANSQLKAKDVQP